MTDGLNDVKSRLDNGEHKYARRLDQIQEWNSISQRENT
jgi:hypothetical protein